MLTECPRCYTSLAVGAGQSARLWCPQCGTDVKTLASTAPANTKMMLEKAHLGEVPVPRATVDAGYGLTAARPQAATLSVAARALNKDGPPEQVFRPNGFWQAAFLIVALSCFAIAFAFFSPYLHRPLRTAAPGSLFVLISLFTVGGFASAYAGLRLIGTKYLIYPECLVYVHQGEPIQLPWDQIRSVIRVPGPGFRIVAGNGQILNLNGAIGRFFALGNLIEERMAKALLPALLETLEAERVVSFGPLSADKTGIYCQEHAIPWLRLLSLSFGLDYKEPSWRKRIRKGLFLCVNHEIRIKIGEIRNYRLFELMVLHHQPACQVQPLAC